MRMITLSFLPSMRLGTIIQKKKGRTLKVNMGFKADTEGQLVAWWLRQLDGYGWRQNSSLRPSNLNEKKKQTKYTGHVCIPAQNPERRRARGEEIVAWPSFKGKTVLPHFSLPLCLFPDKEKKPRYSLSRQWAESQEISSSVHSHLPFCM